MNFIEEFYYGNINPQARSSDQNPKVQKDMQTLSESEDFLRDKLTGEEKRRFISYVDAWATVNGESNLDSLLTPSTANWFTHKEDAMKKITLFSVGGIALAILLVFLTTGAKSSANLPESIVSETIVADTTVVIETEKIPETTKTAVIKPTETETMSTVETTDPPKAKETAAPAAKTVKTKSEPEPEEHGLIIGDYHEPTPYCCGVAGHHCEGPETHSYICELEQKGCEYCGSHNCPSFYAVDQWGAGLLHAEQVPEIRHPCRSGLLLPDMP